MMEFTENKEVILKELNKIYHIGYNDGSDSREKDIVDAKNKGRAEGYIAGTGETMSIVKKVLYMDPGTIANVFGISISPIELLCSRPIEDIKQDIKNYVDLTQNKENSEKALNTLKAFIKEHDISATDIRDIAEDMFEEIGDPYGEDY